MFRQKTAALFDIQERTFHMNSQRFGARSLIGIQCAAQLPDRLDSLARSRAAVQQRRRARESCHAMRRHSLRHGFDHAFFHIEKRLAESAL